MGIGRAKHPLALASLILSYGSVGAHLLHCIGELATHAASDLGVCLVAGVAGIDLHRLIAQLPGRISLWHETLSQEITLA